MSGDVGLDVKLGITQGLTADLTWNTDFAQVEGSNSLSTNAQLRWEYSPGRELFVVYNEERDTLTRQYPDLVNRAFIVKVNRLFRF